MEIIRQFNTDNKPKISIKNKHQITPKNLQ